MANSTICQDRAGYASVACWILALLLMRRMLSGSTATKAADTAAVPTSRCTANTSLSNMINEAVVEVPAHP